MMKPKLVLSTDEKREVERCIGEVEKQTAAEIKVVVVRYCWGDIREKAQRIFHALGLHETEGRNAVMILVVRANREFLIYGDRGIHEKMAEDFWVTTRDAMLTGFKTGELDRGICAGIRIIGEQLAKHFPAGTVNRNELNDEVAYE